MTSSPWQSDRRLFPKGLAPEVQLRCLAGLARGPASPPSGLCLLQLAGFSGCSHTPTLV